MSRPIPSIVVLALLSVACARVPYAPSDAGLLPDSALADAGPGGDPTPERCAPVPPLPARGGVPCSSTDACATGEHCSDHGICVVSAQMPLGHEVASVSDDGRVALIMHRADGIETFQRWTLAGGLEDLPIPSVRAAGIIANELIFVSGHVGYPAILSGDGRVIYSVANLESAPELVRWDGATERRWPIADHPVTRCMLLDASTDGAAMIGTCHAEGGEGAVFHDFRVREGALEPLARGDDQCEPVAMTPSADVVLGYCQQSGGPVQWDDSGVAQILTRPEGAEAITAHAISVDGTIIVGGALVDDPGPGPTRWMPVRWVCGVPHLLPFSPRMMVEGIATDVSADGAFVVGLARAEIDGTGWSHWDEMFGWREGAGTERLSSATEHEPRFRAFVDPRGELAFTAMGGHHWTAESFDADVWIGSIAYVVPRSRRAIGYAEWEFVQTGDDGTGYNERRDRVEGF